MDFGNFADVIWNLNVKQVYRKIPKQVLNGLYCFLIIMSILAVTFTILQLEELTFGCTNHTTLLQALGFPMQFNGLCNDEKFINNSIIQIVGSGLYGYLMLYPAYSLKKEYNTRSQKSIGDKN